MDVCCGLARGSVVVQMVLAGESIYNLLVFGLSCIINNIANLINIEYSIVFVMGSYFQAFSISVVRAAFVRVLVAGKEYALVTVSDCSSAREI